MRRLRNALLALVCVLVGACSAGTIRDRAHDVSNDVAAISNAGGETVLDRMCIAEARAIGHVAHRDGDRCVRDDEARAATPEQRAELEHVRTVWHAVRIAHDEVASAHGVVVALLEAGDAANIGDVLAAVGKLAEAYGHLVSAAEPLGLRLPAMGAQ